MKPLVIIAGPTAVGKTNISIELAKRIGGEIVSADSMQVYRGMDIGTAKITKEEMQGIPHFLIDEFEPDEEFNVMIFKERAKSYIDDILQRGHIPILVGGTGFYIQALVNDIEFTEHNDEDGQLRKKLLLEAEEKGADYMFEKLREVDLPYTKIIHKNNIKKVVRALEYYMLTGKRFSDHNLEQESNKKRAYNAAYFVLNTDRQLLYNNIDTRIDRMLADGLVDEVTALRDRGYDKSLTSLQGLGYKEILDYLDGLCTLEDAVYRIRHGTKLFAKRQLTWFKREGDVIFIDKSAFSDDNSILRYMENMLQNLKIIDEV